ncbi:MAG: TetR/AcrR family transcriptional regulator [Chthonomonadaceae bacterium]|nr:TetR/AcrR family transcriptional regulator [Chthonomonadaceae bacterium]
MAQDETRRRILEAGAALLMERGGLAFTMEAVARETAVTRQTVHNQFGTRADLLEAVCEHVVNLEAFARMPEVFQQHDPFVGIDLFADIFCRFWETNRLFVRRMRGLAHAEPELEGVIRLYDERRLSALRGFVERYGPASGERAARLIRVMFAMTGFEFFEALSQDDTPPESVVSELKQLLRQCIQSL